MFQVCVVSVKVILSKQRYEVLNEFVIVLILVALLHLTFVFNRL